MFLLILLISYKDLNDDSESILIKSTDDTKLRGRNLYSKRYLQCVFPLVLKIKTTHDIQLGK